MTSQLVQVNFKAEDEVALGRFWADVLGWGMASEAPGVVNLEPVGFDWPDPSAVCVDLVRVPDREAVRYRVHLELATASEAHRAELFARLEDLGATRAEGSVADATLLADPEGNEFAVLAPRERHQDTGPIATVVVTCADPRAMVRFWGEAIDWTVHDLTDDRALLRSPQGVGPWLEFRRTPNAQALRSRVHLDVLPVPAGDQAAEVTRLEALGATRTDVGQGEAPWVVLTDPEGNDFCVLGRE
ncbi:VOC family protein [Streptomyces sp. NPDC101181]|uniref:VOC family protein n=1 Tax=Streptomyces sp. NPDC101181 TaxID=3366125 RepID=UPI0038232C1F